MTEIIALSFLAALLSVDVTLFGQFMISRPIVCGPLIGYFLGDIKTGLWVGMLVDLIWIGNIPMGAAIPTDATAVTVLSTIWGIIVFPGQRAGVVLALALAVIAGVLFKQVDIGMRYYNIRIVHWMENGVRKGNDSYINYSVYLGIALFIVKSFVFYVLLSYAGQWVLRKLFVHLTPHMMMGLSHAWYLLPLVGFGMVVVNFRYDKFPGLR